MKVLRNISKFQRPKAMRVRFFSSACLILTQEWKELQKTDK